MPDPYFPTISTQSCRYSSKLLLSGSEVIFPHFGGQFSYRNMPGIREFFQRLPLFLGKLYLSSDRIINP